MIRQPELPLIAPPATADTPLVAVRMVNEHVYCPRLAYLMWVEGEWADTAETADGTRVHARADTPAGTLDEVIHHDEDHVLILDLGPADAAGPGVVSL